MESTILRAIPHRNARVAIGSSSMRGAGSAGVVAAARAFVSELDLAPFGTAVARRFLARLDRTTERLRLALPPQARHRGLARKGLNISCEIVSIRHRSSDLIVYTI